MREFIEQMREQSLVVDVDERPSDEFGAPKMASRTDSLVFFHDLPGGRGVMNVTATRKALSLALCVGEDEIGMRLSRSSYEGSVVRDGNLSMAPADLSRIPVMKFFPGDAGKYLTAGIVFSQYEGVENASIHRMLVLDRDRVAARLVEGRHTHTLHREALSHGEELPVAVAVGVHPAVTFASCSRVPKGKELPFAAELLGGEIRVHQCRNGVLVPDAEIVLEGRILYGEREAEGPYGEYPGYYGPVGDQPVIQFHHATRRRQPVYVHTYIGVPPSDTHALGQMMGEAGLTAKLRNDVAPTVKEVYCALDMHTVVVSLKKTYEEQAKHVIYALWATRSAKTVIVVDDDIDPRNQEEVYWAIANRSHAPRDVIMGDGFGTIGPATNKYGDTVGSKLGIDATAPLKGYPAMSRPRPEMAERVRQRWAELTASQKTKLRRGGRG